MVVKGFSSDNYNYSGQQPQDLSFRCGEQLTIIEPCNVMYWYLAENSEGKRGVMPINFVKVYILMRQCFYVSHKYNSYKSQIH